MRHTRGRRPAARRVGERVRQHQHADRAQYYEKLKEVAAAINAGAAGVQLKTTGPSANAASTNTRLEVAGSSLVRSARGGGRAGSCEAGRVCVTIVLKPGCEGPAGVPW